MTRLTMSGASRPSVSSVVVYLEMQSRSVVAGRGAASASSILTGRREAVKIVRQCEAS